MPCIVNSNIFYTVAFALIGAKVLASLYFHIKTFWPEAYTSVDSAIDEHVRENPIRSYLFFRAAPVFVVTLFVMVLIERVKGKIWLGLAVFLVYYMWTTTAKAIRDTLHEPRASTWPLVMVYHALSAVVIALSALAATLLRYRLQEFVPGKQELLVSLWSGLFAAAFITTIRSVMTAKKLQGRDLIRSLVHDIGEENWKYIEKLSREHGTNFERLIKAVVLSESEQRPRWFRRLEVLKGILYRPGTYGVAQVKSSHPIGSRKSIEVLVNHVASNLNNLNGWADLYNDRLYQSVVNKVLRLHNDDQQQEDRIVRFYDLLRKEDNF